MKLYQEPDVLKIRQNVRAWLIFSMGKLWNIFIYNHNKWSPFWQDIGSKHDQIYYNIGSKLGAKVINGRKLGG